MSTTQHKYTDAQYRRIQGGDLIEQGYSDEEIADILNRSLSTVRLWRKIVREAIEHWLRYKWPHIKKVA